MAGSRQSRARFGLMESSSLTAGCNRSNVGPLSLNWTLLLAMGGYNITYKAKIKKFDVDKDTHPDFATYDLRLRIPNPLGPATSIHSQTH